MEYYYIYKKIIYIVLFAKMKEVNLERISKILFCYECLTNRNYTTVSYMTSKLGVSEKTIYRYINYIKDYFNDIDDYTREVKFLRFKGYYIVEKNGFK